MQVGGMYVEINGYETYYERGGLLRVSSIVGFEEELGDRYGEVRRNLEKVLKEDEVREELEELELYMCDLCDICEVKAEVHDADGSLKLRIETFTEDFLCLPPIERFEAAINIVLRRAGIQK